MGIFSRMKRAAKSKANAAIDKAIDPQKEIEMAIAELEEQNKSALKELLAYKTSAKVMERDIAKMDERASNFEKKAMLAVSNGEDELAKKCLVEKKKALVERDKIVRDRDEAAGYAIELNRSRKQVEARLKMLKLKKGTMATQIAAARSGTGNAFGQDDSAFERFAKAEEGIEDETIAADVQAALDCDDLLASSELEAKILAAGDGPSADADDALEALKAKVAAEASTKQLKPADD